MFLTNLGPRSNHDSVRILNISVLDQMSDSNVHDRTMSLGVSQWTSGPDTHVRIVNLYVNDRTSDPDVHDGTQTPGTNDQTLDPGTPVRSLPHMTLSGPETQTT